MNNKIISLYEYCPRTKYPLSVKELIDFVVQVEDQLNENYICPTLPKYEKLEIKWTPSSLVGFAGNCIKSILP